MKPDVVEIFRAIEVAECFMRAYVKSWIATLEKRGETQRIEAVNQEFERIKTLFFALKMTKFMQLPKRWKNEYSGEDRLIQLLKEDQYPLLVADIALAQEEAQELVNQVNAIVYASGKGMGTIRITDSEFATSIQLGAETFLEDSSTLIRGMEDKEARKPLAKELLMYL